MNRFHILKLILIFNGINSVNINASDFDYRTIDKGVRADKIVGVSLLSFACLNSGLISSSVFNPAAKIASSVVKSNISSDCVASIAKYACLGIGLYTFFKYIKDVNHSNAFLKDVVNDYYGKSMKRYMHQKYGCNVNADFSKFVFTDGNYARQVRSLRDNEFDKMRYSNITWLLGVSLATLSVGVNSVRLLSNKLI